MDMKKKCFLALLFITTNCISQENNKTGITDLTKVTFLNPGISYEKGIGKFQSLYIQGFMTTFCACGYSGSSGNTSTFYFDPALTIQYRYYYNAAKRWEKSKQTGMNSLNYISPILETVFSKRRVSSSHYVENNRRTINKIGVAWGFQRNYKTRFSLDFNLGLGFLIAKATLPNNTGQIITKNAGHFTTVGKLNLGFWLNRRK
jgi:hypothetical protein